MADQDLMDITKPVYDKVSQGEITPDAVMAEGREAIKRKINEQNPEVGILPEVPTSSATNGNYKVLSEESDLKPDVMYQAPEENKGQPEYSEEDIAFTAEQEGMTIEEVKQKLGIADATS